MNVETTLYRARLSCRRPFTPNSFFASVLPRTDWVGAPKLTLSPRAGNLRYATAQEYSEAGTCGNGIPTPFSCFALK